MARRLKRGDMMAVGLVAPFIGLFTLAAVVGSARNPNRSFNFGFGPGVDCRPMPFGEPVCIRKSN
jgi:hypothetical protein